MKLFSVIFLLFAVVSISAENLPDWVKIGPDGNYHVFSDSVTIDENGDAKLEEIIVIKEISAPSHFPFSKIFSREYFKEIKNNPGEKTIKEINFFFPKFFARVFIPYEKESKKIIESTYGNDSTLTINVPREEEKFSVFFLSLMLLCCLSMIACALLSKLSKNEIILEGRTALFLMTLSILLFSASACLSLNYLIRAIIIKEVEYAPMLLFIASMFSFLLLANSIVSDELWGKTFSNATKYLTAEYIFLISGIIVIAPFIGLALIIFWVVSFLATGKIVKNLAKKRKEAEENKKKNVNIQFGGNLSSVK